MKSLKIRAALPLAAVPALLVTGAALLVLVAGVAGAASNSQPGDLLYGVRQPSLMLQMALTADPIRYSELQLQLDGSAVQVHDSPEAAVEPAEHAPDPAAEPTAEEVEFSGTITDIGGGFIVVAGETVQTLNAEVEGALAIGAVVKVHAARDAQGTLVAREISVEEAPGEDANENLNANDDQLDDDKGNLNANDEQFDDSNANLNANDEDLFDDDQNSNANFNVNTNLNANFNQGDDQGGDDSQEHDAIVNSNTGADGGGSSGSGDGDHQTVVDGNQSDSGDNSGGDDSGGGDDHSGGGGGGDD